MNKRPETKTSREDENPLRIKSQYKGTCTTCGKYGHKRKDCWHKEGAKLKKCHYYDKSGHLKKDFQKIIREEKAKSKKMKITKGNVIIEK